MTKLLDRTITKTIKNTKESLVGRIVIIDMLGFSQKEIENKADYSISFILNDDY